MKKLFKEVDISVEKKAEDTYRFIASTSNTDRMGDIIVQEGWVLEPFKKNPVILFAHDYSQPPVGKAVDMGVDAKGLWLDIKFADAEYEFAGTIRKLIDGGFLNAGSVGFRPLEQPKATSQGFVFTKQELLEYSIVPVPANSEALHSLSLKGFETHDLIKSGALAYEKAELCELLVELDALREYKSSRKPVLTELRKWLKYFRKLQNLPKIDDEIKSIEQVFSTLDLTFKNTQSPENQGDSENRQILTEEEIKSVARQILEITK